MTPKRTKQWFTVWVTSNWDNGHFIQAYATFTLEQAYKKAMRDCAKAWGCPLKDVYVRGSAKGDVAIIEWEDDQ